MNLNERNNPEPDTPYAVCQTCGIKLRLQEDAREHMSSTMVPVSDEPGVTARGHGIRITNRTRAERVQDQVEQILQEAVEDEPGRVNIRTRELEITEEAVELAAEKLQEAVDSGDVTHHEVTEALRYQPEFLDAWRRALPKGLDVPDEQMPLFGDKLLGA